MTKSPLMVKAAPVEKKAVIICTVGCRGSNCRRCGYNAWKTLTNPAFRGVNSSWITDDIVNMQRPSDAMIEDSDCNLLEQFNQSGITALFNLQQSGEHPFCGPGILPNGFSYTPEKFMAAGINHFNFNWKDLTCPKIDYACAIVDIALKEIANGGKVAIHCHAGMGRTGLIAACIMIAQRAGTLSALDAVAHVREKRPGSIQTIHQKAFVSTFEKEWPLYQSRQLSPRRGKDYTIAWNEAVLDTPSISKINSNSIIDTHTIDGSATLLSDPISE